MTRCEPEEGVVGFDSESDGRLGIERNIGLFPSRARGRGRGDDFSEKNEVGLDDEREPRWDRGPLDNEWATALGDGTSRLPDPVSCEKV